MPFTQCYHMISFDRLYLLVLTSTKSMRRVHPWVGDGRKGTNSAGDDHSYTSTFMVDGVVSFCLPLFFSIRAFVTATLSRREAFVLLPKDCGSYP